ncbi:Uncharacterized protein Adt_20211 [Abeliophyllum distichum]|uniref:Uncharacterized protein n=1 Tax=Abeliophyllum distichum TaxID=126358 RepID=A0ABD1SVY1_9LAMI
MVLRAEWIRCWFWEKNERCSQFRNFFFFLKWSTADIRFWEKNGRCSDFSQNSSISMTSASPSTSNTSQSHQTSSSQRTKVNENQIIKRDAIPDLRARGTENSEEKIDAHHCIPT